MPSSRTVGITSASASRLHSDSSVWTAVIGDVAWARADGPRRRFATGRGSAPSPPAAAGTSRRPYPRSARWDRRGAGNRGRSTSTPSRLRLASQAERTYSGSPRTPRNSPLGPRTLPNLVARKTWSRRSRIARPTSSSLRADAVHVGGIEEVHAAVDRMVDRRDRLLLAARAVELAHAHAAQADGGDFGAIAAEPPLADFEHGFLPFMIRRAGAALLRVKWDRDPLVARLSRPR